VLPEPLGTRLCVGGGKCGPEEVVVTVVVGAERAGASKQLKSSSVKAPSYSISMPLLMPPFRAGG